MVMRDLLSDTIQAQRLLQVEYNGFTYVVEPYCYGRLWTGEEAVRVYIVQREQGAPISTGWHLLQLSEIHDVNEINGFFDGKRPDFDPYDAAMYFIFSRVEKPFGFLKNLDKLPARSSEYNYSYMWQSRVN